MKRRARPAETVAAMVLMPELREVRELIGRIKTTTSEIRALARELEDDTDPTRRRPDTPDA